MTFILDYYIKNILDDVSLLTDCTGLFPVFQKKRKRKKGNLYHYNSQPSKVGKVIRYKDIINKTK